MSHGPKEEVPLEEVVLDGRRSRPSPVRGGAKEYIVRGLRVIDVHQGDPEAIIRRLAKGKIVRALSGVLVGGQLPEGVEK